MSDSLRPIPSEGRPDDERALRRTADDELPVVSRLVVEIRSDGTRTVARGALEDLVTGQQVGVEARGGSPLELSASLSAALSRALFQAPGLAARRALRSVVPERLRRLKDRLLRGPEA